ncbi:MAG: PAS domain-containing sensor histidine kinase [Acidobacteria bacterium]|nr:PAS domain-containing sensor histidine kinase [Acidobacteriota bacterium]
MKFASHERRVLTLALLAGLPGLLLALILLWVGGYSARTQVTLGAVVAAAWLGFAFAVRHRVAFPLRTISNLLGALREGDFSVRARGARRDDALGEVVVEVNALSETLREQRWGALEATALLRKVMEEIDVAVFAFDGEQRLQLVNRAGERLLDQPVGRLLGRTAADLGLAECLAGDSPRTTSLSFPGSGGRWEVRRSTFRERGLPHQLLVLSDLSRALREGERQAWQRLIRVLGHELNNSLAPIRSVAESLGTVLRREPLPSDWRDDAQRGLGIIGARAEALSRFMGDYARLARLPPPQLRLVNVGEWIRRAAGLETRLQAKLLPGPELTIRADGDQLEQLLINLLQNAADAALESGGDVRVGWSQCDNLLEVRVEDEGPGLPNPANLFVPFFTTKPGGSGIGLVLCRQIAEAHGGTLTLENRKSGRGCVARVRLPL